MSFLLLRWTSGTEDKPENPSHNEVSDRQSQSDHSTEQSEHVEESVLGPVHVLGRGFEVGRVLVRGQVLRVVDGLVQGAGKIPAEDGAQSAGIGRKGFVREQAINRLARAGKSFFYLIFILLQFKLPFFVSSC